MAARNRWKKLVPTVALTAAGFTMTCQTASALFPPIWPSSPAPSVIASPPPTPPVVVVPPVPPPPFVPPVVPPVIVPPPPPPPVVVPPDCCNNPCAVPEPSSLVAGIAGLTTAAGWMARRRKKAG